MDDTVNPFSLLTGLRRERRPRRSPDHPPGIEVLRDLPRSGPEAADLARRRLEDWRRDHE